MRILTSALCCLTESSMAVYHMAAAVARFQHLCESTRFMSHMWPRLFSRFSPALPLYVSGLFLSCRLTSLAVGWKTLIYSNYWQLTWTKLSCISFFSISLLTLADWDGVREESMFSRAKLLLWINLLSDKHKPKSTWMAAALMSNYLNWPLKWATTEEKVVS